MTSYPEMLENFQAGAVEYLLNHPSTDRLVEGGYLGKDASGTVWVFQGSEDDQPYRDIHGTGKGAIVLSFSGFWGNNEHNTQLLPSLNALVYMDNSRHSDGTPKIIDAKNRSLYVAATVRDVFHDPANVIHKWNDKVFVNNCLAVNGPFTYPIPDSDGAHRAWVEFNVALW